MEANGAPEKLYLISDEGCVMLSYDPSTKLQDGDRYDFVDKTVFPIEEGCDIEYIRKDAFIEKVVKFLKEWDAYRVCLEGHKDWFIEQFKKYMEE